MPKWTVFEGRTLEVELPHFFENRWERIGLLIFLLRRIELRASNDHFCTRIRAQKEWYGWVGDCLARQGYSALLLTVPSPGLPNPQQWSDAFAAQSTPIQSRKPTVR